MRKLKHLFLLTVTVSLFFITETAVAQRHNIYLSGSAGYSGLSLVSPDITPVGGAGFAAGAGYEFNYKAFLMQLGVEAAYLMPGLKTDAVERSYDRFDSEGDFYIANFNLSDIQDKYSFLNFNVPLMVGFRMGSFYLLGGGKLKYNLMAKSKTESVLKVTGTYPEFIEDFENMPDHNFNTRLVAADYKIPVDLNAYVSGEVGVNFKFDEESLTKYRISVFFDYGLNKLNNKPKNETLVLEADDFDQSNNLYVNSFMLSEPLNNRLIKDYYTGLRLTVLFGIPDKKPCMCEEYTIVKRKVSKKKIRYKRR